MEYLAILIVLLVASVIVDLRYNIHLYNNWREAIITILFFFVVGIAWDYVAITRGHWSFDGPGLSGIKLGIIPLEEYIFVLIVPYWVLSFYHLIRKKF